ncbi:MAG: hypothetical protein R2787_04490 [Saprospiraceae bacterium]
MQPPYAIDLRQGAGVKGFAILEGQPEGKRLVLPEWSSAGSLGPYVLDLEGNIYVAAVPYVSLEDNPPHEQNRIYRVDTQTGHMAIWADLKAEHLPSRDNPYGVVGLAYDCESDRIFACTVAGSDPMTQRGQIVSIHRLTGDLRIEVEHLDAVGLGIYVGKGQKRLYYGSARSPAVYSFPLDRDGRVTGTQRMEVDLSTIQGAAFDCAHRIRFFTDGRMEIKGIEFGFSLQAASDARRHLYYFQYQPGQDTWSFLSMEKQ